MIRSFYHMINALPTTIGFLLINKPPGITSHDVISKLRKITGIKKIGHAGTLDPFATGLLIVAIGREATREISKFIGMDKTYEAEIVLGATTTSLDTETEIIIDESVRAWRAMPLQQIEIQSNMNTFLGSIEQIPPMYSAVKVHGQRLYKMARQGQSIEVKPRRVRINEFSLLNLSVRAYCNTPLQIVRAHISCSSGTYIRALARDLALSLKTTGFLSALKRTSIGQFKLKYAVNLESLNAKNWQTFVKNLPKMSVDEPGV